MASTLLKAARLDRRLWNVVMSAGFSCTGRGLGHLRGRSSVRVAMAETLSIHDAPSKLGR